MNDVTALETESLRREVKALRMSEARFRKIYENIATGIAITDWNGRLQQCNPAFAALLGYSEEELRGTGFASLIHPDDRERNLVEVDRLRSGELSFFEIENRYVHRDGHPVWVHKHGSVLTDETGSPTHLIALVTDITERKRSEEALRENEERYRQQAEELETIYRSTPIGLGVFDRELRFRRINDRLAEINGVPAEAHIGKTPREVVPALGEVAESLARRVFTSGEPVLNVEIRGDTPAHPGVERFWNEHWLPLKSETGQLWGINIVVEEITERKRMEAVRQREQEFRALAERTPDVVSRFDRDLRYLYINPAIERATGLRPETFIGRRIEALGLPETTAALWVDHLRAVFESGQEAAMESSYPRPDGTEGIYDTLFIPEYTPDGLVETVISVTRDITERKRIEEALARREQAFRAIVEAWPDIVARYDREFRHLYVSPAIERVAGLPPEVFIGKTNRDLGMPEENIRIWESNADQVFATGEPQIAEFTYTGPDGQRHDYEWRLVPEFGTDGQVNTVLAWARDVTARNQAEAAQREAYAKLEQTLAELRATQQRIIQSEKLAALGTLAAGVAHELSNPMMGVMNYIGYARRRAQDPELAYPLERADTELTRMRDLLKGMLSFARPSAAALEAVDLGAVLTRTLALLEPEFRARQIAFARDVPETLPPVQAKADRLQQVFLNLLLNARDAVAESPEKRIVLRAWVTDGDVAVEIADTGKGIPEAVQGRIFDPFFTTKPPGQGTGLGLSIVQSTLNELGGTIEVMSTPGEGAVFTVRLPRTPSA